MKLVVTALLSSLIGLSTSFSEEPKKCDSKSLSALSDRLAVTLVKNACIFKSLSGKACSLLNVGPESIAAGAAAAAATNKAISANEYNMLRKSVETLLKNPRRDYLSFTKAVKALDSEIRKITAQLFPNGAPPPTEKQLNRKLLTLEKNRAQDLRFIEREPEQNRPVYKEHLAAIDKEIAAVKTQIKTLTQNTLDLEARKSDLQKPRAKYAASRSLALLKYSDLQQRVIDVYGSRLWTSRAVTGVLAEGGIIAGVALSQERAALCPILTSKLVSQVADCHAIPMIDGSEVNLLDMSSDEMTKVAKDHPMICDHFENIVDIYDLKAEAYMEYHLSTNELEKVTCSEDQIEFNISGHPSLGLLKYESQLEDGAVKSWNVRENQSDGFNLTATYASDGRKEYPQKFEWKSRGNDQFNGGYQALASELDSGIENRMVQVAQTTSLIQANQMNRVLDCCSGKKNNCPKGTSTKSKGASKSK